MSQINDLIDLTDYMKRVLGNVGTLLEWETDDYDDPVDDTMLACGEDLPADVDQRKLRTIARREVWRAVMQHTAGWHDVTLDGEAMKLAQVHNQARAQFEIATQQSERYDPIPGMPVNVYTVQHRDDPYVRQREDEWR